VSPLLEERTGPSATVTSARNLLRSRDVCQTYARTTVVSGDKVLRRGTRHVVNRAANALRQAANALIRSRSYLGAQYRRLRTKLVPQRPSRPWPTASPDSSIAC